MMVAFVFGTMVIENNFIIADLRQTVKQLQLIGYLSPRKIMAECWLLVLMMVLLDLLVCKKRSLR